ncbi:hypothetical protein [Hyphomicrobium sp. DY-1]|uniref:hypothetical protein n=1 Tax=Hyphomicrobium sp. DY-1 TaxID=3075650 RepID=UPI0039C4A80B
MITHHVDDPRWNDAIVTGFFTPDYEPLAIAFSQNLVAHGVPHMLYDVPASAWENAILLKPMIVSRAMSDNPGKTIILMDIDCVISGDIADAARFEGDMSLCLWARFKFNYGSNKSRLRVLPSSRIIAFKQTAPAKTLIENWSTLCAQYKRTSVQTDDEQILMLALGVTDGLSINNIHKRFIARDPEYATPESVILHYSAHGKTMALTNAKRLKTLKRRLLTALLGRPYPNRDKFQTRGFVDTLRSPPTTDEGAPL